MLVGLLAFSLAADVSEPRVFPRPSPISCGSSLPGLPVSDARFEAPPGGLFWVSVEQGGDIDEERSRDLVFAPSGESAEVALVLEHSDEALRRSEFRFVSLGVRVPEGAVVGDRFFLTSRGILQACPDCEYEPNRIVVEAGATPSLIDVVAEPGGVECSGNCRDDLATSSANVTVRTAGSDAIIEAITDDGLRTGIFFIPADADVVLPIRTVADPELHDVDLVLLDADTGEEIERRTIAADSFFPVPDGGACVDCGCTTTSKTSAPVLALSFAAAALAWFIGRARRCRPR